MITAVTGKPGAGKSFRIVCGIADKLRDGGFVATNVKLVDGWEERAARAALTRRLVPGAIRRYEGKLSRRYFYSDDPAELLRCVAGCQVCGAPPSTTAAGFCSGRSQHRLKEGRGLWTLDEAHEHLNSRTWDGDERLRVVKFLSRSRHRGWDVDLGTQHFDSLDKQLRDRVEFEEVVRNLKRAQIAGIPVVPFNLFMTIKIWVGGPTAKRHVAKRRLYLLDYRRKLYDTHGLAALEPDELDGLEPIWLPRPQPKEPAPTPPKAGGAGSSRTDARC